MNFLAKKQGLCSYKIVLIYERVDGTTTASCMWMNEIKTKTKSSHVTFKFTTRSVVRLSYGQCNGISKEWLHCMTSALKSRFHDVFHDVFMINMMSAHGANTIFFKKWMYRTLANPPPTSDSISFLPYFSTSTPLKVDGICLSSLLC